MKLVRTCALVLALLTVPAIVAGEATAAPGKDEQTKQLISDAVTHGRRVEQTATLKGHPHTMFTEYIPTADVFEHPESVLIRTGTEYVAPDGKLTVATKYWRGFEQVALVRSVKEDGVETVTQVIEYVPGSVDLKVGDSRPIRPVELTAAGKKPSSLDPKHDGSLGRASGGAPVAGATVKPIQETVVREKGADHVKLPDGREFHLSFQTKSKTQLPFVTVLTITKAEWGPDVDARIELHADKDGKVKGVVASVREGRTLTIVFTEKLEGLKVGDKRELPADPGRGNQPSTWDPQPQTGSQQQQQQQDKDQGSTTSGGERTKPETAPDGGATPPADPAPAPAPDPAPSAGSWEQTEHSESTFKDGSHWQSDTYKQEQGEHDLYKWTSTYTDAEGNSNTETHCAKGGEVVDCPAERTDEPTCTSNCEQLELFLALFCAESDCGAPPEGMRPDPEAGQEPPCKESGDREVSGGGTGSAKVEGHRPSCINADAPGGPVNYGDPLDPNGGEPPDIAQFAHPSNDGVTDPVHGEPEHTMANTTKLDMQGTLRDPGDPHGTEDAVPSGGGPPSTGEAERRVSP
jgi:hypothetical protein